MRTTTRILAIGWLVAIVIGTPMAGPAIPASAAPAESMQNVLVHLKSHADLAGTRAGGRREWPGRIERTLRGHAGQTQRPILDLLERRRNQQQVSSVELLWITNAIAVRATPRVIRELARRPDVARVEPDLLTEAPGEGAPATMTTPAVEPNIGLVEAPAMWDKGFRGQGVVVASMDTGVDNTHPDLSSNWRGGGNSWFDPNGQHATPTDISGHGTQTMGVMVGRAAGG